MPMLRPLIPLRLIGRGVHVVPGEEAGFIIEEKHNSHTISLVAETELMTS